MKHNEPVFMGLKADSRNRRIELIRKIQEITKKKLIIYIDHPQHPLSMISKGDIVPFEDILRTTTSDEADLMINSRGGEAEAAEKILFMCRKKFTKGFRVIIPNFAKSAATMLALGSDKILMSDTSEIGPIDPQVRVGQKYIPAQAYIGGLELIRHKIKSQKDPYQLYLPMIDKIQPDLLDYCYTAVQESKEYAEEWLSKYMLRANKAKAKKAAEILSMNDVKQKFKSHGKFINYEQAQKILGTENILVLDKKDELWNLIWELYCRAEQEVVDEGKLKLVENENRSLGQIALSQNMQ